MGDFSLGIMLPVVVSCSATYASPYRYPQSRGKRSGNGRYSNVVTHDLSSVRKKLDRDPGSLRHDAWPRNSRGLNQFSRGSFAITAMSWNPNRRRDFLSFCHGTHGRDPGRLGLRPGGPGPTSRRLRLYDGVRIRAHIVRPIPSLLVI